MILILAAAFSWLPAAAQAQAAGSPTSAQDTASEVSPGRDTKEGSNQDRPDTWVEDSVTVTATRGPRSVDSTPGHVSVIPSEEIEKSLAASVEHLVRFEPGVYVEGDPTRLGLSGFNIRGIGGNRVLTRIDGVATAEEFAFGPLAIHQYSMDVEALQRVEVVRSAGSALYGSDALGGVVSLLTRDPQDYLALGGGSLFFGAKAGYDTRADEASQSLSGAWQGDRWAASLFAGRRDGGELDNQGDVETMDASRTAPNPIDRAATNALAKLTYTPSTSSFWKLSGEVFDSRVDTEAFSSRGVQDLGAGFGPPTSGSGVTYIIDTSDFDARDDQERTRLILENVTTFEALLADDVLWRVWGQQDDTEQVTLEQRDTTIGGGFFGPLTTTTVERTGTFRFDQEAYGTEAQAHKAWATARTRHRLTYGAGYERQKFGTLRDRVDVDPDSGMPIPPGPSSTPFPTKYFPDSTVDEAGIYIQDEIDLFGGRLMVVPGVRWDRFDLDADENDAVYLSGNPGTLAPVDLTESAVSPRLGAVYAFGADPGRGVSVFAQYAGGFRAPAYTEVNNGFTNPAFGYQTLPNPNLEPETSDNLELGIRFTGRRARLSITAFDNRYEDFIETVTLGVDPSGLILFQPRNVAEARIRGVELAGRARLGDSWLLRGAYAHIEGENEVSGFDLDSIEPPRLALGLAYRPYSEGWGGARWGAELAASLTEARDTDNLDPAGIGGSEPFAAPSYEVLDLTAYYDITRRLRLDVGLFNLTDETYWTVGSYRGLGNGSSVLDRYTRPGRTAAVNLRYRR